MILKKATLALMISAVLTGCGSSDGEDTTISSEDPIPTPPEAPEERLFNTGDLSAEPSLAGEISTGVYRYSTTSALGDGTTDGIAIVSDSGRIAFALDSRTSFARIQLNEDKRFDERLKDTEAYVMQEVRRIRGGRDTISSDADRVERISGTVINSETQTLVESFNLEKQANEAEPLSLAMLAGAYTQEGEAGVVTRLTFAEDGTFTGADTSECEFSGSSRIPTPSEPVVELQFTVENCQSSTEITAEQKNGDYFAVGRIDTDAQTLQLFAGNGGIAVRYNLTDINAPSQAAESAGEQPFASQDFDIEPTVEAKLKAGIYQYTDIPLEAEESADAPEPESGILMISPTGRMALGTDRRALVARTTVSELDRFSAGVVQTKPDSATSEDDPDDAAVISGMPYNTDDTGFLVVGSLISDGGDLVNRFEAAWLDQAADFELSPLSLESIAGTYATQPTGTTGAFENVTSLTINTDGTVTGQDTLGCIMNGQAAIPSSTQGLIEVNLMLEGCGPSLTKPADERNGTYSGLAAYVLGDTADSLDLVIGSDANTDYIRNLVRQ